MAHDSKREQIIQNIIDTIQNIESIKTVKRSHPSSPTQLKSIPAAQIPWVGITAGLPKIGKYFSNMENNYSKINSNLQIILACVALHKDDPDKWISFYTDEIWDALYTDQSRGGFAISTRLEPNIADGMDTPYIGFYVVITINYNHDTKGI